MRICFAGVSHHTSPVELREKLAVPQARLARTLAHIKHQADLSECALLSTCNRTELYAAAESAEPLLECLRELGGLHKSQLLQHATREEGDEAVRHLFRVASGLDSMVVGESQILGQVRQAYEAAREMDATGLLLGRLFESALSCGKRVRSETAINRAEASVASVAVDLARKTLGSLKGRRVLLLGAGDVSTMTAERLMRGGATSIIVANRTHSHALDVAARFGGTAIHYEELERELLESDILIASSSAPRFMIHREPLEKIMLQRELRPLVLIDIAVPRDVEPSVAEVGGVTLYDIDDLNAVVARGARRRPSELQLAMRIIEEQVNEFLAWQRMLRAAPVIRGLRGLLERMALEERERYQPRLRDLTGDERQAVEEMLRSLINKLTHPPINRLKEYASANEIDRLIALADLFGISEDDLDADWRGYGI